MPSHERRSPRAAIQDWLSHTSVTSEATKRPSRRGHVSNQASRGYPDIEEKLPRQRQSNAEGKGRSPNQSLQEVHSLSRPQPEKTARSLGLDVPFRSFDHPNNAAELLVGCETPMRKRRRSISSTSSYLETAKAVDHRQSRANDLKRQNKPKIIRDVSQCSGATSQSSEFLPSLNPTIRSAEKPAKVYERRLRRKTREDHYKLKHTNTPRKKREKSEKKNGSSAKERKNRRKEKSGTALMHEFTAQNVAQDRLTLHSAPKLGVFAKGRTSSPFRRSGLPDLAFSEMTFLNPRKEKPKNSIHATEKKSRRKRDKNADAEAEISRYFTSKKSLDYRQQLSEDQPAFESSHPKYRDEGLYRVRETSKREDPSLSLAGLPEKPFLGFGSSGPPTTSPETRLQMIHKSNRATQSQSRTLSPTRSTTYYTWSKTGGSSPNSDNLHSFRSISAHASSHLVQRVEPLSPRHTNNTNSRKHRNIDQPCPTGGASSSFNRDAAQNSSDKRLPDQMAQPPGSQSRIDNLDQDKAASAVAESLDKGKADTLVGGVIANNNPVDGRLIADGVLQSSPGPYGLSTKMPLASFDMGLETLITNSGGPALNSLPDAAQKTSTISGIQNGKQNTDSCKILRSDEHDRNGTVNTDNKTNHMPSENLAPKCMAPPASEINMPQLHRSSTDDITHCTGRCLSTSNSGRGPAILSNSFGKFSSSESDDPRENHRAALNAWSSHDNIYEQQLASRDSYLNSNQEIYERAPRRTKDFSGPVDFDNEAVNAQHGYGFYPNLENISYLDSQGPNNQRLRLDEDLIYHYEEHQADAESNHDFRHNHNGLFYDENSFLVENENLEEDLMYPPNNSYKQSDIYRIYNHPRDQIEVSKRIHPWDVGPQNQAHTKRLEQNEEVTIPGFWKPNKLY